MNELTNQETQAQIQPVSPQFVLPQKIEFGTVSTIISIVVFLVGLGVAWGTLKTLLKTMQRTLDTEIKPNLTNIRERFAGVESKVDVLWKDKYAPAESPRQLNEKGQRVLEESGIKQIIDQKKEKLLSLVKEKNPQNSYDAEKQIEAIVMELPKHCPEVISELKTGAFNAGVNIADVLFIGGIHLRNLIFEDLGFKLDDLDKQKK